MRRQIFILSGEPQRKALLRFVESVNLDLPLRITIEEERRKRSHAQLGLYWMWVNDVADKVAEHTGHTPEEIHSFLKERFLSPKVITIRGIDHSIYTTKKLSVEEMRTFMDRVYHWATTELGLLLPLPEERFVR